MRKYLTLISILILVLVGCEKDAAQETTEQSQKGN
jgi:uncharacterized protein YcfL